MDRLPTVIAAAALAALGCNDGSSSGGSRERVNAVKAEAPAAVDPAAMCDRHYPAGKGPALTWPALTAPAPAARAGAWHWINLWATWCKPCIEELPRLQAWRGRLAKAGVDVDLSLVSADESDDEVAAFRKAHPGTPDGVRLAEPESVAPWIAALGVKGATLPVHIFVDPTGAVRCVRASAIEESDYAAVHALMR